MADVRGFKLRSGFVGLTRTGLRNPTKVDQSVLTRIINKPHLQTVDDYFYHETIQDLYVKTIEGSREGILNRLEFQELILKAGAEAFGISNFWDWIIAQYASNSITALHHSFLIETLNYVAGIPRKTSVQQWIRLLEATNDDSLIVTQGNSLYMSLVELQRSNRVPAAIPQLFITWLQQPAGFTDLICSLEVIFGNRRLLNKTS